MPTIPSSDGTPLAYTVREGPSPTLVFCNGLACTDSYWRPLLDRLSGRARLLTWDYKGHGRSGPAKAKEAASIPALAEDLVRVTDAVAPGEKVALLGFSMGCQVILEAWRQRPDRILALVPTFGSYARPFDTLLHPKVGPLAFRVYGGFGPRRHRLLLRTGWLASRSPLFHALNQQTAMVGKALEREHMLPFYNHLRDLDPTTWTWMLRGAQAHSAEDVLPTIRVPTLVIAGGSDRFTPPACARTMAERIPGARLLELPRATHAGLLDEAEQVSATIEQFFLEVGLLAPKRA